MTGKRILAAAMTIAAASGLTAIASSPASAAAPKPISVGVSTIGELNIVDTAGVNNVKVDITMGTNEVLVSSNAPITIGRNCRTFATQMFARTVACRTVSATTAQMSGGADLLQVRSLNTNIVAFMGAGNDTVSLSFVANSTIFGESDKDTINGGGGNDFIRGGSGNDTITGGSGNDNLDGEADVDVVKGNAGQDAIGSGDTVKDTVDCGANPAGQPDSAFVDRIDKVVAGTCESVRFA